MGTGLGLGFALGAGRVAAAAVSSYSAEATALFARMTAQPTPTRAGQIDTLINALKTGATSGSNIWSKLDVLYVLAAADDQASLLNWKGNATYDATVDGGVAFTANQGWTATNSGDALESAYVFSVPTSAHLGVYCLTDNDVAGNDAAIGSGTRLSVPGAGTASTINRLAGGGNIVLPTGNNPSHACLARFGTSSIGYRNAVAGTTATSSSSVSGNLIMCTGIGFISFSSRLTSIVHAGAGLTGAEVLDAYNAFHAYLQAVAGIA